MINNDGKIFSIKNFMQKVGRTMSTISAVLLIFVLIVFVLLWYSSPGKMKPYLDENGNILKGSISEKIHVKINGIEQGMIIKSKDVTKPVLLYLHGGPGMPLYFLNEKYPANLEENFTVCWWDQRGAGLSYNSNIPVETMNVDQFISDTIEVTKYLRDRFGKDKIYLMGHSWGSLVGIRTAEKAPHLYSAYIGMAQMANQMKSEQIAYEYMLSEYKNIGDTKMAKKLEKIKVTETGDSLTPEYKAIRDKAMHRFHIGTTRDMDSVITGIFLPSLQNSEYTLSEKIDLWRGKISSGRIMFNKEVMSKDLTKVVTELKIPVYFCIGAYDYTCNYSLAEDYFEKLKAPLKGLYIFDKSAHSPVFEEPLKMNNIIKLDILTLTNNLADKK